MSDEAWRKQHHLIEDMALSIKDFPRPVIAAVEGYAMGGGCEIALMTDFIIASETAKFALPEATRGIMPGAGGMQNLARAIGMRRAKELIFTGRSIDANLAYEWGLVNRVVPKGKALETAVEVAKQIIEAAPISIRMAKLAISRGAEVDFHTGYMLDIAAYNVVVSTEDRLEGVAAFNEKRKPCWKNR
jgi:enoyl-CoA hydratase/carnithine racemase